MLNSPTRRHGDGDIPAESPSVRVLLIDDDPNFRAWLALLMRRLNFAVEVACDGVHAFEILRNNTFDLIICDYQMPRMNGIDFIHELRGNAALANQYTVMLTSHDDLDSKVAALTSGYDDFLAKSCTETEVIAKVIAAKRLLARSRVLSAAAREWQTLATRDELTGVATRRSLTDEAARCLGEGRTVGVVLFDLDDFKPVNDTFGHLTGDRILRDVGALFLSRTRGNDLIARFGGDEFVLLVRDLPLEDVHGAAQRLTAEIESKQWTSGEATFCVKATSGIAHSSLIPHATLDQLLEAADRDLYAKKWVKKHPGERPELYEYPGASRDAAVVPLPLDAAKKKRAVEE